MASFLRRRPERPSVWSWLELAMDRAGTLAGARRKEGREIRSQDDTDAGTYRRNGERHGADCAGRVSVDHLRRSSGLRIPLGDYDVGGNFRGADARLRYRRIVLGAG